MNPFKHVVLARAFDLALASGKNNWSEFYYGWPDYGPRWPRRGAGHRCAYWDGWNGTKSLYSRAKGTLAYPYYVAGKHARAELAKRQTHSKEV